MKIPSDIAYIRKASAEIENFLKSYKIDSSTLFDIRLCVEEAVRNAIVHGNRNDKKLSVFVSYSFKNGKLVIEIEDEGKGFDPKKVPDPTKGKYLLKAGGRGVYLIQKLMDEVEYKDGGNKLSMVKFIRNKKGENNAD